MSITDELYSQLSGEPMQQIGQQLGVGQAQLGGAVAAALPLLLGALGRNAGQPQGAESLFGALERDHAGASDIGDVLGAVLGGQQSRQTDGPGQLAHIFGGRQQRAATGLGEATGLGGDKAQMLLKMLAPVVLAFLAKRMFGGRAQDGASPQALGEVLGREQEQVRQQGGLGGGLLGAVLDQDGDGQLGLGDLLKMGGSVLGNRR